VLRVSDLTISYGGEPVLEGASLVVERGQFVSLVGPSGSGKSSLLRAVVGLQQPLKGTVEREIASSDVAILFQDDALLPWKTARDNVALGLTLNGMRRRQALEQADRWLERLGLARFGHPFPRHLSGGQRKRVALAQVLAREPKLLLMDEPFASLDAIARAHHAGRRSAGRARAHQRAARHPRPRRSDQSLGSHLPVLPWAARTSHQGLSGAAATASRSSMRAHASRVRAALREALERPLARGRPKAMNPRGVWARQLAAFAVLLVIWEAAGRADLLNPMYAPSPSRIGAALVDLFGSGRIWPHLEATFTAALVGLVLGILTGILLGVLGALLPLVAELLEPVMMLLNAIPRVILAPLFVIWLGIGIASKVALAFILVAVLIFFTVFTGIRQVDRKLVERVVTLGGGRWALVRHVYLPSVAAWVLGSLKVAVGFAFTGAVVGEFVAASRGLGYLLSFAQSTYNSALMLALVLLIMVVVLVIFAVAGRLEKYLLRWN
jgi:NitT/TauT family transport system permease protein